ncbi:MAG: hypothetical protein IJK18_05420 [Clostridia bacterium]|nr:hypothetical protein [Clostridia bacterium]
MKNKKRLIIISICIVLLLIILGIIGFIIKNKQEKSQPTGTEWGDLYFNKLKDAISKGNLQVAKKNNLETTISFIQKEDNETPIMITQYQSESPIPDSDNTVTMNNSNVYYIDENNEVKQVYWGTSIKTDIEYLYNIKEDKYLWYVKEDITDSSPTYNYLSLTQYMNYQKELNSKKDEEERNNLYKEFSKEKIAINKNETTSTTSSNAYNYDDIFVKVDDVQNYSSKTYLSTPLKELNELVKKMITEKYKNNNDILTDEIKQNVANKLQEIENKKEEAKKVAKEEEREKIAEESAKGFKVGKYTLKYGTYKGKGKLLNADKEYSATFVLNSNGTYTYTRIIEGGNGNIKVSGTFYATKDTLYGIEVTGPEGAFDGIGTKSTNGDYGFFSVGEGNTIWDMEIKMTYTGN